MLGLMEKEPLVSNEVRSDIDEVLTSPLPSFFSQQLEEVYPLLEERELLLKARELRNIPGEQRRISRERLKTVEGELEGRHAMARAIRDGWDPYTIPDTYYVAEFDKPERKAIPSTMRTIRIIANYTVPSLAIVSWIFSDPRGAVDVLAAGGAVYAGTIAIERITTRPHTVSGADLGLEFRAPILPNILERYDRARSTRLFDAFLIAGPNFEDFRVTRTMLTDPVMVGLVRRNKMEKIIFETTRRQNAGGYRELGQRERFPGVVIENANTLLIGQWDLSKDRQAVGLAF